MPRSRFSDDGDSISAGIPETDVLGSPSDSQRPIPPTGTTQSTEGTHIPVTDGNQHEDAQSSVSETTAVETGLKMDPGSRARARARELEHETSRFCADPSYPLTGFRPATALVSHTLTHENSRMAEQEPSQPLDNVPATAPSSQTIRVVTIRVHAEAAF
ncbi:hypothetical protein MTO96_032159 [Rhipicephalus appendiculatus]